MASTVGSSGGHWIKIVGIILAVVGGAILAFEYQNTGLAIFGAILLGIGILAIIFG